MSKILTVDDLVQFCVANNLMNFSSKDSGYQLIVSSPATFEKKEVTEDTSTLFGKVKVFHTGRNRNGSSVTEEAAKKSLDGIKYKPLLANFCEFEDENGEMVKDFTSHDMVINEDGTTTYLERQIGCFTADEPYMETEEDGRTFVWANVAIPREYSDAASIIERKNGTKVSAELAVNKLSYDANEKLLLLEDIEVMGLTCLGTNPETGEEVQEGMQGARLDIADFSADKNSVKFSSDEKLIETLEKINKTLERFNIDHIRKEDTQVEFEDETKKTTEDDIAPTEEFTEEVVETETETETPVEQVVEVEVPVVTEETVTEEEAEIPAVEETTEPVFAYKDLVEKFSLSLSDKQHAMFDLINETYGELDNDLYDCDVYDEDRYVVMHGIFNDKHYKQQYKVKKETYSLVGDRVEVFAQYLTQDEIDQLTADKANYAQAVDKLSKYESEPEKMQILESADYGYVVGAEEFAELKKQENHFDLTVDEVKQKADSILLDYVKKSDFSAIKEETKVVGKKTLPVTIKVTKKSRYGGLFKKED